MSDRNKRSKRERRMPGRRAKAGGAQEKAGRGAVLEPYKQPPRAREGRIWVDARLFEHLLASKHRTLNPLIRFARQPGGTVSCATGPHSFPQRRQISIPIPEILPFSDCTPYALHSQLCKASFTRVGKITFTDKNQVYIAF